MAQIYKKENGEWSYRVFYRDEFGKRHSVNNSHFKKKSDAQNTAREIEMKKTQVGISQQKENITFDDYFKQWIKIYKAGRFSKSTQTKYDLIQRFVHDSFGKTKLKKITKFEYQQALDKYAEKHVKTTVSMVNGAIKASLKDALEQQIIHLDFTRNAILSGEKKPKEIKYFEIDKANEIRQYCLKNSNIYKITRYAIALSMAIGLRYTEVVGLTWNDIDFDNNTIDVNKTYDYKNRTGFPTH